MRRLGLPDVKGHSDVARPAMRADRSGGRGQGKVTDIRLAHPMKLSDVFIPHLQDSDESLPPLESPPTPSAPACRQPLDLQATSGGPLRHAASCVAPDDPTARNTCDREERNIKK